MTIRDRIARLIPTITRRTRFKVRPALPPDQALPLIRAHLVAALRIQPNPPRYINETADGIFYERGYPTGRWDAGSIGRCDPGTIRLTATGAEIEVSVQVQLRDEGVTFMSIVPAVACLLGVEPAAYKALSVIFFLTFFPTLHFTMPFWWFRRWLKAETAKAAGAVPDTEAVDDEA